MAQVEPEGVVVDAPEDRNRQAAQRFFKLAQAAAAQALGLLRTDAQGGAGQTGHRLRAAADHAQGIGYCDLPALAEHGGQRRGDAFGLGADLRLRAAEQAQAGEAFGQAVGVAIEVEHRFQRRKGQLVDAQGALERVLLDLLDQRLAADDQPGLRAAEQLVAAEGDDVGAVAQRFLHRRLFGQAPAREVEQAAAAQIFQQRQIVGMGDARQLGGGDAGSETLHAVVAGMHAHQQP